jgi:hypothetical protein
MTYNTHEIDEFALPLPITSAARRKAQEFASQQPTPEKAEQVRLNTLAVHVVNDYLQLIGFPTDLSKSDIWQPLLRLSADVADVFVTGIGRLECRPLQKHRESCYIPPEVLSDRIGYVVVQIDESFLEATVLGFSKTVTSEELPLNQLQPIEDLIDHLHQPQVIEETATEAETEPITYTTNTTKVNLSQWLGNIFETGWQAIETLLNQGEPELTIAFRSAESAVLDSELNLREPELETAFRSAESTVFDSEISAPGGIKRAKLIDLGMQLAGYTVALIVELTPQSHNRRHILLQVHPTGNQIYLPPLLQLTVLDEFGLVFLEAQARSADNYIQLQFSGLPGEQFSVKVALGEASITEDFVI